MPFSVAQIVRFRKISRSEACKAAIMMINSHKSAGVAMKIYGLKTCDTCRKAIKALPDAHFVDVRAQGMPSAVMARAYETFNDALVNTRSTTWRGLGEDVRNQSHLDLLAAHPTLMKRPLIIDGDVLYLGWSKEVQTALGLA